MSLKALITTCLLGYEYNNGGQGGGGYGFDPMGGGGFGGMDVGGGGGFEQGANPGSASKGSEKKVRLLLFSLKMTIILDVWIGQ